MAATRAYLRNELAADERIKFIAALLFPANVEARDLFVGTAFREPSNDERRLMRAFTRFPEDPTAAKLQYQNDSGRQLSEGERLDLFSRGAKLLGEDEAVRYERALKLLGVWSNRPGTLGKAAADHLAPFMECELKSVANGSMTRPSTNRELASLLNISPQLIGGLIDAAADADLRARRRTVVGSSRADDSRAYHQALGRLHQLVKICDADGGASSAALGIKSLCALFGVTPPTIRVWLEKAGIGTGNPNRRALAEEASEAWLDQFKRPAVKERARAVVEEVRQELLKAQGNDAPAISSDERLGRLHGVSAGSIYLSLRAGLTKAERSTREQILRAAAHQQLSADLSQESIVLDAVCTEMDEHKVGRRAKLSTLEELAEQIGCGVTAVNRHLRKLSTAEGAYRDLALNAQRAEASTIGNVITAVWREMEASTTERPVRTVRELAAALGMSASHTGKILRQAEDPAVHARLSAVRKQTAINNVSEETIQHRDRVVAFVKEEIDSHRRGLIRRLSHNDELRKRFSVSETYLWYNLVDEDHGRLSKSEISYRRSILSKQTSERTFAEHGHPFSRIGPDKRAKMMDALRKRRNVQTLGSYFDSVEEAVCAEYLKKYIPGWKPEPGVSCQVRAGSYAFDFRVESILVEYHPILLFWSDSGLGEFSSAREYNKFRDIESRFASRDDRLLWRERVTLMLGLRYWRARQFLADSHPETASCNVVWIGDAGSLYDRVLSSYASDMTRSEFVREFAQRKRRLAMGRL